MLFIQTTSCSPVGTWEGKCGIATCSHCQSVIYDSLVRGHALQTLTPMLQGSLQRHFRATEYTTISASPHGELLRQLYRCENPPESGWSYLSHLQSGRKQTEVEVYLLQTVSDSMSNSDYLFWSAAPFSLSPFTLKHSVWGLPQRFMITMWTGYWFLRCHYKIIWQ